MGGGSWDQREESVRFGDYWMYGKDSLVDDVKILD